MTLIPGVAAIGAAALYAVGAALTTAQLRGADLDVASTLPLVPIEQLLARGIGTVVVTAVVLPLAALFIGVMLQLERREERRYQQYDDDFAARIERLRASSDDNQRREVIKEGDNFIRKLERRVQRLRILMAASLVFGLCWLALTPLRLFPLFVGTGLGAAVGMRTANNATRIAPRVLLGSATGGIACALVLAWVDPAPLPSATLDTTAGPVRGGLVVVSADKWVLQVDDGQIVGIPTRVVRRGAIRHLPRDPGASAVGALFGWDPVRDAVRNRR